MSHFIPVFILPIEWRGVPDVPTVDWASRKVAEARENVEQSGLRESTSTNWWHCFLTAQLCRHWKIEGLEFLKDELRLLSPTEIETASAGLNVLTEKLKAGPLPLDDSDLGPELAVMRNVPLADVIESAAPAYVVDEASGDLHSYIVFLASLQAALQASQPERRLLYYAPQP